MRAIIEREIRLAILLRLSRPRPGSSWRSLGAVAAPGGGPRGTEHPQGNSANNQSRLGRRIGRPTHELSISRSLEIPRVHAKTESRICAPCVIRCGPSTIFLPVPNMFMFHVMLLELVLFQVYVVDFFQIRAPEELLH